MNRTARNLFMAVIGVIIMISLMNLMGPTGSMFTARPKELKTGEFMKELESKNVAEANWQQRQISGTLKDGTKFFVNAMEPEAQGAGPILEELRASGANYDIKPAPVSSIVISILSMIALPLTILLIFYFFVIRPAQMGGNQALNFGRSRAKRVGETGTKVTFEDVAGIDEAKQELFEIVDFLKNTKKYTALGAKIPKGILLTGPPGVGKTHLARAIAGEAGVPFFHISGSDFVEMFVGVGAARVRDLFETAKAHRPSLIFVDEIDAVGRQRGAGMGGGHDEREQTLNQLLVEMDGFDPNSGVILIAATNRPDVLDPALLRPGRFDRQIVVDAPDAKGREEIFRIHSKGKPMDSEVDLGRLARLTPGFTGADLANMLNEGALLAARENRTKITQADLSEALDRVIAGPQRKSRVFDEKEREVIAYHEAGHAVVGELLEKSDPVHKVTILPRGMSLGSTWHMPEADKYLTSEQELLDDLTSLLGGRVAEEIVYNEITTGASNDLQRVTAIARAMVCDYGMSDKLGTLAIGRRSHNPFLGRDYVQDERNYSEEVAKLIDEEVRRIVDQCHQRAHEVITANRSKLDAVVQALLKYETLTREEFLMVMDGKSLPERDMTPPTKGLQVPVDEPSV
ncbi:MAG TPA: ATP-dependent zinc metalloprotease FtsH, partial [Fimbriimonadaceae bacterium]|nr:ATP-dependent zinc metalloprotease FtsH [Fimbriimonadaceae bacterium]